MKLIDVHSIQIADETFVAADPAAVGRAVSDRTALRRWFPDLGLTVVEDRAEKGVRWNIHVGIRYLEAWLGGSGCEPIRNLMEDLATSEISRAQLWQWLRFAAVLEDGRKINMDLYRGLLSEELGAIRAEYGPGRYDGGRFPEAVDLFMRMVQKDEFDEFLSVPAYELLP